MNPVAEDLTGWDEPEAAGKPLEDIFNIINGQTGERAVNPVAKVLREGVVVGLADHTVLIAKDGTKRPIADGGAPIKDEEGELKIIIQGKLGLLRSDFYAAMPNRFPMNFTCPLISSFSTPFIRR